MIMIIHKEIPAKILYEDDKVRFAGEVIGEGIGRTRREAHHQAAIESLMNLAACSGSSSEPTHACRALCGAATENANSDRDLEVVAENISVNHNHLCLRCSFLESSSEPTHPCRALCGAAIENADSDSDLEVVAENISVNHNHLCLGCRYDEEKQVVDDVIAGIQLAHLPDKKRGIFLDDDSGSIDSKVSGQGKFDLTNLDELVDLFFYKEPEDAKEPEDELAVADYKDYGAGNLGMKDWSATPVAGGADEIPEPALSINFARDGMQEKDRLSLVAVHSDSWLLSVAFYFGARFGFDKAERPNAESEKVDYDLQNTKPESTSEERQQSSPPSSSSLNEHRRCPPPLTIRLS
ncbi:PHD finger protein ALFIN-LIKE 7-like protein isoform X2 [Tanacetum coccineum]|uniref:PHD finger protein ALFIN-LIKE n=1 Tax=Tanacetum coccineum TaxID=301880 RepID=A0ABQ5CLB8_9ASTR